MLTRRNTRRTLRHLTAIAEHDNPGLRKMIAEVGGPWGFEDVVAALKPICSRQADIPAHWDVTFAVDSAEAGARKATELGAKVLAGPFDAPWARTTVIQVSKSAAASVSAGPGCRARDASCRRVAESKGESAVVPRFLWSQSRKALW